MENKKQGKKEKKKRLNYLNKKITEKWLILTVHWVFQGESHWFKCLLKRTKGKMFLELKCKQLRAKYVIFIQMPNLLNMSFHSSNVIILLINSITK